LKAERKEKYIVVDQLDGSITIYQEELPEFVKSVIEGQQRLLNNNYVELSSDDMIEIYNNVYDK